MNHSQMNKSSVFFALNILGWLIFHAATLLVYYERESGIKECFKVL